MPLLQQKKPKLTTPPTGLHGVDSPRAEQDMLSLSDMNSEDCYSDRGFPTLPRPKVILSLNGHSSTNWNPQSASLLQTVPVRILTTSKPVERSRSFSVDDTAALPLDLVSERFKEYGSGVKLAGSDTESKHSSPDDSLARSDPTQLTEAVRPRVVRSKSLFCHHSKVYNSVVVHSSSGSRPRVLHSSNSSPLLLNSNRGEQSPLTTAVQRNSQANMNFSHSRSFSRKAAAAGDGTQTRTKKTRKPARSLTFSFGSGSDKKRMSLGFLGSKKPSKHSDNTDFLSVHHTVSPSSPILMGNRRSSVRSNSSSATDLQYHSIVEEKGSLKLNEEWGQTQVYPRQDNGTPLQNHFGSYRDVHSLDEIERAKNRPYTPLNIPGRCNTDSPFLDYSVMSASDLSSRQESLESLTLSMRSEPPPTFTYSNPPSRSQSPNMLHRGKGPGVKDDLMVSLAHERKLSEPTTSTPDLPDSLSQSYGSSKFDGESSKGPFVRKRNTFCVRDTRLTHKAEWHEMRHHVVRFLLETEQSYVQSLRTIIKVYMEPLNRPQAAALVEPSVAKEIFYQIPEVCRLHEKFLDQVIGRVEGWNSESKIGDVFVNTFSKCQLMDIYSKFIGNFMRAKSAIELAKQARPVFSRFLEQRAKDSRGRFTLDDLLIKPVQRIPRYVLFIKDLLKHTSIAHPDHAPLQQALGELTALAERVNASERERGRLEEERELISGVDGLVHLMKPQSRFIRYDMVTEIKGNVLKRDRFLILFSDMIVCACARRKSTGFIRSSLLNINSMFSDTHKHTVKWHVPLSEVSRAHIHGLTFDKRRQNTVEKMLDNVRKDESTILKMLDLSTSLQTPHQSVNSTLKNLLSEVREKIAEKKAELDNLPVESGRLDLTSYSGSSPCQYSLVFPSQRLRTTWEVEFLEAKSKNDRQTPPNSSVAPPTRPPPIVMTHHVPSELEFLYPVLLETGKVGIELTCGTLGLPLDCPSPSCLWVCCSDGSKGEISVLDILDVNTSSPSSCVLANISVTDSRISNIAVVCDHSLLTPVISDDVISDDIINGDSSLPPMISVDSFTSSSSSVSSGNSDAHTDISCSDNFSNLEDSISNLDIPDYDPNTGQNSSSEPTSAAMSTRDHSQLSPSSFKRVRSNSAPLFIDRLSSCESSPLDMVYSPQAIDIDSKVFSPLTLRPANLKSEGLGDEGCGHCMWLGTDDGNIYVYGPGSSLRSRSYEQTVDLSVPITCLKYIDGTVFVGLANGALAMFDSSSRPDCGPVRCVSVSTEPVVACVPLVTGVGVCSGGTLFQVSEDKQTVTPLATLPSDGVIKDAVAMEEGVWISVQNTATLHLIHMPSGLLLATVDCTRTVMSLLQGYNPIIRQHKSASLHSTHLLLTSTRLVVGTSAGVVVTIPLPHNTLLNEPHLLTHPPTPVPLFQGHVGPVNFLTSVKTENSILIITGGIGCEDFVTMTTSQEVPETCNCLLVWSINF